VKNYRGNGTRIETKAVVKGEMEIRELHQHKNQGIAATAKGAQEQESRSFLTVKWLDVF